MKNKNLLYWATVILSVVCIFLGNYIAGYDKADNPNADDTVYVRAKITEIVSAKVTVLSQTAEKTYKQTDVVFKAKIESGEKKGDIVSASQTLSDYASYRIKQVEAGDKVILINSSYNLPGEESTDWFLAEYIRSDAMIGLLALFVIAVLFFGRKKGISTLFSLLLTCLVIFMVLIPAILAGKNIYVWTAITCIYMVVMTLCLVNGYSKKTLAAILGCLGGIMVSALLCFVMQKIIRLTGFIDEEDIYLLQINPENPVDLKAIVYSAILIGAVGAIMDVSVDISSSLSELSRKVGKVSFADMFSSGVRIGRDIMGTMANTLVLAYIGSSLSLVLLLASYNTSTLYLFNMESIVIEVMQSLVGSLGILSAIPLTAAISSALYNREAVTKKWFMQ